MNDPDTSKFPKGGDLGMKGPKFQINITTIFLLKALEILQDWKLSFENRLAGVFDDVVLEYPKGAILLQAKYRENKDVDFNDLFSTNPKKKDFSLPKYFLSYQDIKTEFQVTNVVICTNTVVNLKHNSDILQNHVVDRNSVLYCEGHKCCFYTFKDTVAPLLKEKIKEYYKNKTGNEIEDENISDDKIKDFLKHLQFYYRYPQEKVLTEVIKRLLLGLRRNDAIYSNVSAQDLHDKIATWLQLPPGKYDYVTNNFARAMFSEIRNDKYCEQLDQYNVLFEKNNCFFGGASRIFHVFADGGFLLPLLSIFRILQHHKMEALYISPNDSAYLQKKTLEAFAVTRHTVLVITCPQITLYADPYVYFKLREILNTDNKKIIVVTERNNQLIRLIDENNNIPRVTYAGLTFNDFSKDTQRALLKKKNIIFLGRRMSLKDVLGTEINKRADKLNSTLLEKLITNEEITVTLMTKPSNQIQCYNKFTLEVVDELDLLRFPIEHGVLVNVGNEAGNTALHLATSNGHFETLELLLQRGANVNVQNREGNTALHLAVDAGKHEVIELLLRHGADVNIANKSSNTALHLAANEGKVDIVKILLDYIDVTTMETITRSEHAAEPN